MKANWRLLKSVVLVLVLSLLGCRTTPPGGNVDAKCDDVAERGFLNVITINLLFSEVETRNTRLEAIADFIAENDVDVLLLQEVVNGVLVETENSAQDLRDMLFTKHDLNYDLRTAFEIGLPGLLSVANATLSRCEIRFSLVKRLPRASEIEFDDQVIKLGRNILMTRLEIPDLGKIDAYNTHLCARCEVNERADQVDELLRFANALTDNIPGDNPSILAGDLNFDRFDDEGEERFLYEKIIDAGFIDAYAESKTAQPGSQDTLDTLCENEDKADEHCTVGVSSLDGENARRVDYIFTRGLGEVREGKVLFNTLVNEDEPTVSDHAAVFTSLTLP